MTIPIDQILRSKRKTLALVVRPDGSLLVRAPWRTPGTVIQEFVQKNRGWIETKQAEALAALPPAPRKYMPGEMFLYLGTNYPLALVEGQPEPLLLDDGKFKLALSQHGDGASAFEHWYREQARQVLTARVEFFARQFDFQYKRIRITSARTRWGSCSATGSLSFSWRLILAPLEVVDYVVVHELVHTVFHNHSKQFWARVGSVMPDSPKHRRWLRENGRQLLV